MSLEIDITATAGAFRLAASFEVAPGEVLAVLGANGAGKSTLLAAIAGHRPHASGTIALNGTAIPASTAPERRRIGLLGQRAMLFPHLSALENVAFGPRAQGVPASAARSRAAELLADVGLPDVGRRRPAELSGGQQQRVALARALAADPHALLLDEPFASLDAETGTQARRLIAQMRDRLAIPIVLVTHDAVDAVMLAARTVVLDAGAVVQHGATAEVLGHPTTRFAAAIAGVNLVAGVGERVGGGEHGGTEHGAGALSALRSQFGPVSAAQNDTNRDWNRNEHAQNDTNRDRNEGEADRREPAYRGDLADRGDLLLVGTGDRLAPGEAGTAVFSPSAVRVTAPAAAGGATWTDDVNTWTGTVTIMEAAAAGIRLFTAEHPQIAVDVPSGTAAALGIGPGATLSFAVSPADVSIRRG